MHANEANTAKVQIRPYRKLKDDPKFDQIRNLIKNLPPEKIVLLEKRLKRWSGDCRFESHRSSIGA